MNNNDNDGDHDAAAAAVHTDAIILQMPACPSVSEVMSLNNGTAYT